MTSAPDLPESRPSEIPLENRPLIIAHRGRTPETIENSLSGIRAAIAAGADMVEVDVRLSLDLVPVLYHDAVLGRVARGRGPVRALPVTVLRRLPLRGGGGETIPTLAAALRALPPHVGMAIEIKPRDGLRHVLRTLRRHGRERRIWLWINRVEAARLARRLAPDIPVTLLEAPWTGDIYAYLERARAVGARGVSYDWSAVSPEAVRLAHDLGLRVFAVNHNPGRLEEALTAGLDGGITGDPAFARAVLRST